MMMLEMLQGKVVEQVALAQNIILKIKSFTNQGTDSTMYDFEYDDKGNLLKAKTAYGVAIENEYNSNNNLIRNTVTNGKTMLETKKIIILMDL